MAKASITVKYIGDVTFNPGDIADGDVAEVTASIPGKQIRPGDMVLVNKGTEDDVYAIAAWVSDVDEITVTFFNPSGGNVDGDEQVLGVIVF